MTTDPLDLSTTDGQLLARFAQSGEQAPFEAIVRRHGSLVLGVCRAVLGGAGAQHDAEDAAQATFLTLARKSRSLGGYDSIAGWLYRVAWHIAKRTRSARELRTRREQEAAAENAAQHARATVSGSVANDDTVELLEALHDELNKLSEKYRLPLILHHLEGWTEPEIAELLGCRVGTLSGRLSRGRQMLRDRIARHRHHLSSISAGAVGTALLEQARGSALNPAMQHHLLAPATAGGAGVSAQAATLAQGAIHMLWRKVLLAGSTYAACAAILLIGTGLVMHALIKPQPQVARLGGPMLITNPADPTGELIARRIRPTTGSGHELAMNNKFTGEVSGTLLGPDGQPVSGVTVKIFATREAVARGEKPLVSATTDERGEFVFPDVPAGNNLLLVCTATKPQPLTAEVTIPQVSENQPADLGTIRLSAR